MSSKTTDTLPTNEEIIADLTKDLEQCAVKADSVNGDKLVANDNASSNPPLTSSGSCDSANVNLHKEGLQDNKGNCSTKSRMDDDFELFGENDDNIDEEALKNAEVNLTEEEKQERKQKAEEIKLSANELFKFGNYEEAASKYTLALRICPLQYETDRAILYSNRAAAKIKMDLKKEAVKDCSRAIELNPTYLKALLRRAQTYEILEKLDDALEDYQKILKIEPYHKEAMAASKRLPFEIEQRNEKLKTEMLSKLKDLGNMILKPFNLSTENFELNKDPNSGGYSVNFKQNPR